MNERRCPKPPEPPVPPFLPPDHGMPIRTHGVPIGAVMAFAGLLSDPDKGRNNKFLLEKSGWALCDGRQLEEDEYPELFKAIGHVYGGECGTFNIPDYGGYFLRGVSVSENSKGRDPDAKEREFNASGGGSPGDAGSTQEDALQKHVHEYDTVSISTAPGGEIPSAASLVIEKPSKTKGPEKSEDDPVNSEKVKVSDSETRPKNIYVHFIIKCK